MKSWLQLHLAQDPALGIAAGLEFCYLDRAIQTVKDLLKPPSNGKLPTELELALAIEDSLRTMLMKPLPGASEAWAPLRSYLHIKNTEEWTAKSRRRLISLSNTLTHLFLQYGKYGGRWLQGWEASSTTHWQQQLWSQLFHPDAPWTYLYRELKKPFYPRSSSPDLVVHLFSVSFLPTIYFDFFKECDPQIPIKHYLLSPCQQFWSDIRSQREMTWLLRTFEKKGVSGSQRMDLESYLRDCNPLLANFGKLGRERTLKIEESVENLEEMYTLHNSIADHPAYAPFLQPETHFASDEGPLTLLEALQADMQLLRNPVKTIKPQFSHYDGSVQLHSAPSKLREVQAIYDVLLGILDRHSDNQEDPIGPRDIVVMAPDIGDYEPFIKMVFQDAESLCNVQIMDLCLASQNRVVQGFLHLLSLPSSRWDAVSVFTLFRHPSFQKKHQIKGEEIHHLETWIKECRITWGRTVVHRNEILRREHCRNAILDESSVGTWDYGLRRLIGGLIQAGESTEHLPIPPYEEIDFAQGEFLGKVVVLLETLEQELKCLTDNSSLSLGEWAAKLQHLLESNFAFEEGDREGAQKLYDFFDALRAANSRLPQALFKFETIFWHIESFLSDKGSTYHESHLSAIRFCSLLPMRTIPAKIIVLMGMQEGAFPRQQIRSSLDLMGGQEQADYCPSQQDFDRYLFLETLLSARRYFLMSYVNLSEEDHKEQPPSLLISELMHYMDSAYEISGGACSTLCTTRHPYNPFDQIYFAAHTSCPSYSWTQYNNALAFYHQQKKTPFSFMPAFVWQQAKGKIEKIRIDIRELSSFAGNPLKAYFNRSLGIYLENENQKEMEVAERFQLSLLDQDKIRKSALKNSFHTALERSCKLGQIPFGILRDLAIDRLQEDIQDLQDNLNKAGADPKELFEVEFSELFSVPRRDHTGKWQLPPLNLRHQDYGDILLVGNFSEVSEQGLVLHRKGKAEDIVKVVPHFLAFQSLIRLYSLPFKPQLIFAKDGKVGDPFTEDPEKELAKYIAYYLSGLENASPLIPEWVSHFLTEDPSKVQEKLASTINNPFSKIYNEYLHWLLRGGGFPHAEPMIDQWKPFAEELFSDAFACWTPKKRKKNDA